MRHRRAGTSLGGPIRTATLAASAIFLVAACWGDPGYNFWVRNDSPNHYVLKLVVHVREMPSSDVAPTAAVWDVPGGASGKATVGMGTWDGSVSLLTNTCAKVADFVAPAWGGTVWIKADGEASLVDYAVAFPSFTTETSRLLAPTAQCQFP